MKKIDKAFAYALEKHQGQYRKNLDIPYFTHVVEVMKILVTWGVQDETILCAAILHDILEDCDVTKEELAFEFGLNVASMVVALTKTGSDKSIESKWDYMKTFTEKPWQVVIIKMADRVSNVKDFVISKNNHYAAWYALQAHHLMSKFKDIPEEYKDDMYLDMHFLQSMAYTYDSDVTEAMSVYVYGKDLEEIVFDDNFNDLAKKCYMEGKP